MNKKLIPALVMVLFFLGYGCKKNKVIPITPPPRHDTTVLINKPAHPNIIFLLADDMGYEMPTFNGGGSYNTSHLDSLAANAMVFNQCRATPLCSPSRVQLLSGLYNFRNYIQHGWGIYDTKYTSYVKGLQQNGYKTCVVGKWQLDGGNTAISDVGFDDFCVWNASNELFRGHFYKDATLYDEMGLLPASVTIGNYSEDIISSYAYNFIDQNKKRPFFIYYSFNLVHEPMQPTPLDAAYKSFDDDISDTTYIGSMVHYLDLKVGALINKLKADSLDKNTIIVFAGDNGSEPYFHSLFNGREVKGEKSFTTELGTHVPLFVYWPGYIKPGINNNLIDFTDFAPTFLDMASVKSKPPGLDGVSFFPQLFLDNSNARSWTYCFYDPFPVAPLNNHHIIPTSPIVYAQDTEYKLYRGGSGRRAGKFYHFTIDLEEEHPLNEDHLAPNEVVIKQKLEAALNMYQ